MVPSESESFAAISLFERPRPTSSAILRSVWPRTAASIVSSGEVVRLDCAIWLKNLTTFVTMPGLIMAPPCATVRMAALSSGTDTPFKR